MKTQVHEKGCVTQEKYDNYWYSIQIQKYN